MNSGTCKIFDVPGHNAAYPIAFCHSVNHGSFKVRHRPHQSGVDIHSLYIGKCDQPGELFNMPNFSNPSSIQWNRLYDYL